MNGFNPRIPFQRNPRVFQTLPAMSESSQSRVPSRRRPPASRNRSASRSKRIFNRGAGSSAKRTEHPFGSFHGAHSFLSGVCAFGLPALPSAIGGNPAEASRQFSLGNRCMWSDGPAWLEYFACNCPRYSVLCPGGNLTTILITLQHGLIRRRAVEKNDRASPVPAQLSYGLPARTSHSHSRPSTRFAVPK